ncbi:MAG: hypothetical protein KKC80_05080 [Candidatus Margulisbacteria bacterium]|nr:hypothetical protein [Candidatus Margulisiibacteriota bacterium]
MNIIYTLHIVSILLEVVAVIIGLMLALKKGKLYGWLISLTFIIYVFYDVSNFLINTGILYAPFMDISKEFLYTLFFLATLSIVWAVWEMYVEAR